MRKKQGMYLEGIMNAELKEEKENVLQLMIERDFVRSRLNLYEKMWSKLQKVLLGSVSASRTLYKNSNDERWLYYADSDSQVLYRMRELEVEFGKNRENDCGI